MRKVVRITESDLVRIVTRVLNEQVSLSNVPDNTNVVLPRLKTPSENSKYYKESTELTRQGCTQTNYEFDVNFPDIDKGECFIKNNQSLKSLIDKKAYGMYNIRVDEKVLQSIPDAVYQGNKGVLYYFCDKNPVDKKSNFLHLLKQRINNSISHYYLQSTIPQKKGIGNPEKEIITLDTPLRKFFCSGR